MKARNERSVFQLTHEKWHDAAKVIADEFSWPITEVEEILRTRMHQIEQRARIKEFVPVLAIKQVRDSLRLHRASA